MSCIAPSLVLPSDQASLIGTIVEKRISAEYLAFTKRPAFFPAPPAIDFADFTSGFGNNTIYIAYLVDKNPSLSPSQLLQLTDDGLKKIPDIVTADAPRSSEFYEFKPNSPSGLREGDRKVANVHALFQGNRLPYTPGIKWNVDKRVQIFSGGLYGVQVDVYFHFFRIQPGLIVYDFCAEGRTRKLTNSEIVTIILAILIVLLSPIKIPIPVPA